jgi:hypothetical protein
MSNYIILLNFTEQGIRNVKDTINRAEAFKNAVEKAGGKFPRRRRFSPFQTVDNEGFGEAIRKEIREIQTESYNKGV